MCEWDLHVWIDPLRVNGPSTGDMDRNSSCERNLHMWTGPPCMNRSSTCKWDLVTYMCECVLHVWMGPTHDCEGLAHVNRSTCKLDLHPRVTGPPSEKGTSTCEYDLHMLTGPRPPCVNKLFTGKPDTCKRVLQDCERDLYVKRPALMNNSSTCEQVLHMCELDLLV